MKRSLFALSVFLFALLLCCAAFPWASEHPAGVPIGQHPEWPAGLADLVNAAGRVYGYWVNANDWFFYEGDTGDFTAFLKKYSALKGTPLMLVLHSGKGKTGRLGDEEENIQYDWEVKVLCRGWHLEAPADPTSGKSGYVVILEVWLGGNVSLEKLNVPPNLTVKTAEKNEAFSRFIADHEKKKKNTEETEKPKDPNAGNEDGETPSTAGGSVEATGRVTYKSEKPRYAKVVLNADGSKVLSVVFDESGGTGKGYDILYADVNFNGKFEESEMLMKLSQPPVVHYSLRTGLVPVGWSSLTFPPISVPVPYNEGGKGIENPCQIVFTYQRYLSTERSILRESTGIVLVESPVPDKLKEEFSARCEIRLRQDFSSWEYSFEGGIEPSENPEAAPVLSFNGKPAFDLIVKPDGRVKGNAGVGLGLLVAGNRFECKKEGSPPKARVEIRKPDGEVVHQGEATLDKFTFG